MGLWFDDSGEGLRDPLNPDRRRRDRFRAVCDIDGCDMVHYSKLNRRWDMCLRRWLADLHPWLDWLHPGTWVEPSAAGMTVEEVSDGV